MLGTNIHQDVLHVRRPTLNYVSPAICEAVFSGSSFATLVLEQQVFDRLTAVTGPRYTNWDNTTGTWQLEWDVYPDALCYNVYVEGPVGTFTLVAECVPNPTYDPNDPGGNNPVGDPNDRPPGTPGNPTTPGNPPGPQTPGNPGVTVVITVVTPGGESPFPQTPEPPAPTFFFYSAAYTASCPPGYIGTPITKPYGAYTSLLNQSDADFQAINAANAALVCNVIYYSAEYTATCPPGFVGTPVTKAAGAYTSIISQVDADTQAIAAAEFELSCTEDPGCGGVPSSFAGLEWTFTYPGILPPPCVIGAGAGATGTFEIHMDGNPSDPCDTLQEAVQLEATICNLGAPYPITVTIPWGNSGSLNAGWPFHSVGFELDVGGVVQQNEDKDLIGAADSPVILTGTIPTGTSVIRLYIVASCDPTPAVDVTGSFTLS